MCNQGKRNTFLNCGKISESATAGMPFEVLEQMMEDMPHSKTFEELMGDRKCSFNQRVAQLERSGKCMPTENQGEETFLNCRNISENATSGIPFDMMEHSSCKDV